MDALFSLFLLLTTLQDIFDDRTNPADSPRPTAVDIATSSYLTESKNVNQAKTVSTSKRVDIQETQSSSDLHKRYSVTKVIDGDTIVVARDGKRDTVRLIGIDTPETNHPFQPQECFGKEAAEKATNMLAGKRVRLVSDPRLSNRGKYGRLLRYVYLPDGRLFNKLMIAKGYAYEFTYKLPYRYQDEFKKAQASARAGGRGLWAPAACADTPRQDTHKEQQRGETAASTSVRKDRQVCSANVYDCSDFQTQAGAQATFLHCGGPQRDPHWLDGDKDGYACERLPDE